MNLTRIYSIALALARTGSALFSLDRLVCHITGTPLPGKLPVLWFAQRAGLVHDTIHGESLAPVIDTIHSGRYRRVTSEVGKTLFR